MTGQSISLNSSIRARIHDDEAFKRKFRPSVYGNERAPNLFMEQAYPAENPSMPLWRPVKTH